MSVWRPIQCVAELISDSLPSLNKPRSLHYSTLPLETTQQYPNLQSVSTSEHQIYAHLLETCLHQCKQIQSRRLFDEMPQRVSYALRVGKIVHAQGLKLGFGSVGHLGSAIVDLYAKCGDVNFAEKAFSQLQKGNTSAFNSVLSMYSRRGTLEHVIQLFGSMQNWGMRPNQFTCAIILSVCARFFDVEFGKQVHSLLVKIGLEFDSFCEGSLIDMYSKCGHIIKARQIFDGAVAPDTVSWTAMISGYAQIGLPEEALQLFDEMQKQGYVPDQVAFVTAITAYVKIGRLDGARHLFSQMPRRNSIAWNAMISGHAQKGYEVESINFFRGMNKSGIKSTRSTLGSVLSVIASFQNLTHGTQIHALATKMGLDSNVYVGSSLINMYSKCQKLESARTVFDSLHEKNIVLWNSMLGGYAQNGYASDCFELFSYWENYGFNPDEFSYTSILSACACLENINIGQQLHSYIIKHKFESNLFVGNALVDMYAKTGALFNARKQFELMRNRDNVSWNAIIVGYVQEEEEDEAFCLFQRMRSNGINPDEVCFASILSACANIKAMDKGKQLHSLLIKCGIQTSLYAGSSLIDMYAKCEAIEDAHKAYSFMPKRGVVSTNALIAGYAQTNIEEAVKIFRCMLSEGLNPSEVTFASILEASELNLGIQLHCLILKIGLSYNDEFLVVSLLGMYIKSRRKRDSDTLFSDLPNPKSTVLWTALISGYTQIDSSKEALIFFREMRNSNAISDQATFASILRACSIVASLQDGMKIHSLVFRTSFDRDELTSSALIDMYAKCGDLESSIRVFDEISTKNDVISWNSMIVGLAKNGYTEALEIFDEMKKTKVKPDEITFLGILTACSHTGRVSEGREIFDTMINRYEIQPRMDHCACMIDLFGRWGFLEEAEEFIEKIKNFEPDSMIWASFLGACRLHGDEKRGQKAAEKLIELEPENSSPYVLLSNIYADSRNWDGVDSVRKEMKEKGVRKFPGCSWVVVGQKTSLFVAGDKFHPDADEIHEVLKDLTVVMKNEGCVAENIESFALGDE